VSGILTLRSGSPITITAGRDVNLDGNNTDRPHVLRDPRLEPNRSRSEVTNMWFDTAAFAIPQNGENGNAGRGILDGPGVRNADIGVLRNFRVREGMELTFRTELRNAFNWVSLNNPITAMGSNGFGAIRTARQMREVQLGLRLAF
jgi:hypothetical protein